MPKKGMGVNRKIDLRLKAFFGEIPLNFQRENNIFCFLALLLLNMSDEETKENEERMQSFLYSIEVRIMQALKISEVANGNNSI